jgi:four helix bundle protein
MAPVVLLSTRVGARTHRQLVVWQLANELRKRVFEFTSAERVKGDEDYCRQIRRAINSACHNTAEGFNRYRHREFANSLHIARGELGEVDDQLEAGKLAGHLTEEECEELLTLCSKAVAANTALLRHLEKRGKEPA